MGIFTGWMERLPELHLHALLLHDLLPHGAIPASDITFGASLLALLAVTIIWLGLPRLGGLLVALAAIGGLFGADQLWTTAGCTLFCGSVLSIFGSGPSVESNASPIKQK